MGVVVSAIATGLIHNIGVDCNCANKKIEESSNDVDDIKEEVTLKEASKPSPQKIKTPGFPSITFHQDQAPSSPLKSANINKEQSVLPPPPPPQVLYPPNPSPVPPPPPPAIPPVPGVKHKQIQVRLFGSLKSESVGKCGKH